MQYDNHEAVLIHSNTIPFPVQMQDKVVFTRALTCNSEWSQGLAFLNQPISFPNTE